MNKKALFGLKVLELCEFVAGPYCTKLLADLGAEVVKVEDPGIGDKSRRRGPFVGNVPHPERSVLFLYLNTNKMGITLNIESVTGRELLKKLVKEADIVVEDKPPGVMKELLLDYDILSSINRGLVMVSITPYGQSGPYHRYNSYYLNVFHGSGQGYLLPTYAVNLDRGPIKVAGFTGEYACGIDAAIAALGALHARRLTGCGQHVDVSKQESLLSMQRVEIGEYLNLGVFETRATVYGAVSGPAYECKNGYVVLEVPLEHMWQRLVELMGSPDWTKEKWCKDEVARIKNRKKVRLKLEEWFRGYTKNEIYHLCQSAGVPVAPVNSPEDVANSKQYEERGYFVEVSSQTTGKLKYPGAPCKFSETPFTLAQPAPVLGEHNEKIYCNRLGYSKPDLCKMRETGII